MTDAMKAFNDVLKYFETGKEAEWMGNTQTPNERDHGALAEVRLEAYCDVYTYEDGYVERYYIGD